MGSTEASAGSALGALECLGSALELHSASGLILGSCLESCSLCWHCTGDAGSVLETLGLILGF